ncbi:MAG: ABC transporter ATP-binding protein [Alphaproteobacteria bacterium]|nr:ABC transporter ATP-binding protein [Alphaproteobacteria bacterium]
MNELLEIDDLVVRFRVVGMTKALLKGIRDPFIDAVLNVSFDVKEGETFGLVGESGSGKTTLGRAIIGLAPTKSGSIKFKGVELTTLGDGAFKQYRRNIAMMFQDPVASLSPRLTVRSLLAEPFKIHNMRDRDLDAEARRLLEMVGLNDSFFGRYPHELSGGQARRVGVARALSLEPKLIIADEPTAGLDVSVQGEVLNLLARLQSKLGLSYLIITHNLPVIRHVSDRIAIMYLGRFVEYGRTEEIFRHAAHPYTRALISAVPQPDPDLRREIVKLVGEIPSLANRPSGCEFHTRCPFARTECRESIPAQREIAPGHGHRCHFPLPEPEADAA